MLFGAFEAASIPNEDVLLSQPMLEAAAAEEGNFRRLKRRTRRHVVTVATQGSSTT
jgi:hypothetical protein